MKTMSMNDDGQNHKQKMNNMTSVNTMSAGCWDVACDFHQAPLWMHFFSSFITYHHVSSLSSLIHEWTSQSQSPYSFYLYSFTSFLGTSAFHFHAEVQFSLIIYLSLCP